MSLADASNSSHGTLTLQQYSRNLKQLCFLVDAAMQQLLSSIQTCLWAPRGVPIVTRSSWILRTGGAPLLSLGVGTTGCMGEPTPPGPPANTVSGQMTVRLSQMRQRMRPPAHLGVHFCSLRWGWTGWRSGAVGWQEQEDPPTGNQAETELQRLV